MWLFLIALNLFLIYFWFKTKYSYWDRLGFPSLPGKIPFGSIEGVGSVEHKSVFLKRQYENFKHKGKAFGTYFLARPVLIITDIELIKSILVTNFDNFHDHGMYHNKDADPLNDNIFFKSGKEWKTLRAMLSPTFTSGKMKMMFPIVSSAMDRLIEFLRPYSERDEPVEMKEICSSITIEVIASVAFGLEVKCLGNAESQFRKIGLSVFEPSIYRNFKSFFIFSFERLAKILNMGLNSSEVNKYFREIISDVVNYRETTNYQRNDFLQLLINMKNGETGMTLLDIVANGFIFFAAGFETSSSVISFAIYEMAKNVEIQEKLRNEINDTLGDREVTYDSLAEMKYLNMVFNETMRRYPSIDAQIRKSSRDFKIPNTDLIIPAETLLMIPTYGIHMDENFYENPEKFDPERFTDENIKKRSPFTFIPFSAGPRSCIGVRFGMMETKIALVKLLKNFKILTCEKTMKEIEFMPNAALQTPKDRMWLKLQRIQ